MIVIGGWAMKVLFLTVFMAPNGDLQEVRTREFETVAECKDHLTMYKPFLRTKDGWVTHSCIIQTGA